MKTLKTFDFFSSTNSAMGTPRYNWDELLNGGVHFLQPGEDFDCPAKTMAAQYRNKAKKKGLAPSVKIVKAGDKEIIEHINAQFKEAGEKSPLKYVEDSKEEICVVCQVSKKVTAKAEKEESEKPKEKAKK